MPSILEILRKNNAPAAPANQTAMSETDAVRRLAAAKSGKATTAGGVPTQSNLGEQAANAAGAAQQAQVAATQGLATEGAVQQAMDTETQAAQAKQTVAGDLSRGTERQQLGEAKSLAYQKLFQESMNSEQTRQRIQQKAKQEMWEDQNRFESSLQKDIFGQERYDLLRQLGFKNDLNADQRAFEVAFENMKNEDIYKFAIEEFKSAARRGQMQAVGTMASGAAQYAGRADSSPTSAAPANTAASGGALRADQKMNSGNN